MTSTTNDYILVFEDACQWYPDLQTGERHNVLNDIDLRIRRGELMTIMGPSGCGKSTLFRLILGSEKPKSGRVLINGKDIEEPGPDRGIVFQKYSLFPHLTVRENIRFGLEVAKYGLWHYYRWKYTPNSLRRILYPQQYADLKRMDDEVMEMILKVRLREEDADKVVRQLSGGMQQRVAIGQAIIMKPGVLLMDEPLGALDTTTRHDLRLLILELQEEYDITIILVTHDPDEAGLLGKRLIGLSPFYSTKFGQGEKLGSMVVYDAQTSKVHPKPPEWLFSDEFANLMADITREVLDPTYHQSIRSFKDTHPDCYRTIDPELIDDDLYKEETADGDKEKRE